MELEEARKILNFLIWKLEKPPENTIATTNNNEINAIRTVLNHITKQEKMIELMVNWIDDHEDPFEGCHENGKCEDESIPCGECIKQYFEKKAEESE